MFSLRPWQVTFNIIQPLFCTTVRHVIFPKCACIILASPIEIFFWLAVSNPGPKHYSGFPHCHRLHNGISAGLADGQCFDGHHQAKELVAKYSLYEISAPTFMMTSPASSPPWTFQGATWGTLVLSSASSTSFWVPAQSGKLNGHLWQRNGCRGGTAFSTRILPRATKQLFQVFHMIAQCSLQKKAREDWQWVGGGLRWIAPKYVELQKHKVPGSKKIVEMKSGTQIIDQCWRFLKARIPLNHNCTVGSRTLCLKLRSAQYEYCNPGKDLWAYRCACPMVHAEHGQGCVEATMQNGGRNVLISCLH